jgi:4-amino-4-deoxy-L-arabinose transferase-like glycosyltransferase
MRKFLLWIIIIIWIVGIILRFDVFLINKPLWHDECSLALSLFDRGVFDYFRPLEHYQCAPPFFMGLTKLLTYVFGIREFSLRLIPLLAGIFSLPAFYLLSKKFFKNYWTIILANLLFAINRQLIYYSQEFKQYSLDVLLCILTIYYLIDFDIKSASKKQLTIFAIIIALLPLLSFPTLFILLTYFVLQLCKYKQTIFKKILLSAIPIFLLLGTYYVKVAFISHSTQIDVGSYMWNVGFLKFSLSSLINIAKLNFNFFFEPNPTLLFGLILFILGAKNKQNILLSGLVLTSLIMSLCKFYPLYQRTCLYLVPILLIILLTPIERINKSKKLYSIIVILLTIGYFGASGLGYKSFITKNIIQKEDAKTTLKIIKDNYNAGEIVCFNDASMSEFIFYSKYYNFTKIPNVKITSMAGENYEYTLNQLPKGYVYWFYYPFEFGKAPVKTKLKNWSKNYKILKEYKSNNSYVVKLLVK